jgi:two-component sensor histidine kinase
LASYGDECWESDVYDGMVSQNLEPPTFRPFFGPRVTLPPAELIRRFVDGFMILTDIVRRELTSSSRSCREDLLKRCEGRIAALGDLQKVLMDSANGERISVQGYVERLCKDLSEALLSPLSIRCEVFADQRDLSGHRCVWLGFFIAEFATSVARQAIEDGGDGLMRIEIIDKTDWLLCSVSVDRLDGPPITAAVDFEVIDELVSALGGTVVWTSELHRTSAVVRLWLR